MALLAVTPSTGSKSLKKGTESRSCQCTGGGRRRNVTPLGWQRSDARSCDIILSRLAIFIHPALGPLATVAPPPRAH